MRHVVDWSPYPNFSRDEMKCNHTSMCKMEIDFMDRLQLLRTKCDFPLIVSSGYRASTHPVEARKERPGEHYYGRAADIKVSHDQAFKVIEIAPHLGFTRLGVKQNGSAESRFIHLGTSTPEQGFVSPTIWSY